MKVEIQSGPLALLPTLLVALALPLPCGTLCIGGAQQPEVSPP